MLNYSDRALLTRSAFYAAYNDVTIIVEDTTAENFYTKLFQWLVGDTVKIGRVIGVGGKERVLLRFEDFKDNNDGSGSKEFYLVDGDFDELIGRALPDARQLYRLPRYDIESFLMEAHAICVIAEEQNPQRNAEAYERKINFDIWQEEIVAAVTRLIACFALLHSIGVSSPQGRPTIERFISGNNDFPDVSKVDEYICSSRISQDVLTEEDFDIQLQYMLEKMGDSLADRLRWISGKHILLPLLIRRLKRKTQRNIALDSLRFRLMGHCQLASLSELRQRVLDTLG